MKIYFAGSENMTHLTSLRELDAEHFLASFYSIKKWHFTPEEKVLLDSGGFTARTKGVDINVHEYCDFINKNEVKLAINLDTNDVDETLKNQEIIEKETDAYIMPVYHLSDCISKDYKGLLDDFINNYPYICIGGMAGGRNKKTQVKRFLDYVFSKTKDKTKVHGLGLTGEKFTETYPLYSIDSTSWLSFQIFGQSRVVKNKLLVKFHNKETHYSERNAFEIKYWIKRQEYLNTLWDKRGVSWNE